MTVSKEGSGMNRCVLLLIVGSLLLPLGCGGPTDLQPSDFCGDHSDAAIATFEDSNLEAAVRVALSVGPGEQLTCGLVSGLTRLDGGWAEITSLTGIQNLTSLTLLGLGSNFSITDIGALSGLTSLIELELTSNSISDIGALSGLTSLTLLGLDGNSISDIGALSGLTSLTILLLAGNSISDIGALSGLTGLTILDLTSNPNLTNIQPLLDNTGLGAGDLVFLLSTSVSCTDVAALQTNGVSVRSDC